MQVCKALNMLERLRSSDASNTENQRVFMTPTLSSLWGTGCYDANFVITGGTAVVMMPSLSSLVAPVIMMPTLSTPVPPHRPGATSNNDRVGIIATLDFQCQRVSELRHTITAVRQRRNLIVTLVPAFRCSTVVTNVHSDLSTVQCQAIA